MDKLMQKSTKRTSFPSATDKPFYLVTRNAPIYSKGSLIAHAPYNKKLLVLAVYKDNNIKKFLVNRGIRKVLWWKVRRNELKVKYTKLKNESIV